ncbi:MAG: caspase family protein, partial [Planctomycetaceae bacterium]|nr:caspase family protein [Planctomycetaceae bacterium]
MATRRWSLIGLALSSSLATWMGLDAFAQGQSRAGRKFALLAGVRQYKTPALRALNYPDRDVEELAKVLLEAGFSGDDIRVLTQERAARELRSMPSSDNIRTELARMLKLVKLRDNPADTVLVALAGHGIMDPKSEASYFCPADTGAKDLAPDDPALIDLGQLYD